MFENNTTPDQVQDLATKPSYEELEERIAELHKELSLVADQRTENWELWNKLVTKVNKAEIAFKDILAGDTDASSIIETYGEVLAEHLGWSFTREVEIELSVTWRGTIQLPQGVEVGDLDIDDFGIEINGHNEYESDISYYFHDSDISER